MSPLSKEDFREDVLLCIVCGKPVDWDDWFLIVNQADETLKTGSRILGLSQKPVHLSCVAIQPPKEI